MVKLKQRLSDMQVDFDYTKALEELDQIAVKVENPDTALEDIDALIKRSDELISLCRNYLRTIRNKTSEL